MRNNTEERAEVRLHKGFQIKGEKFILKSVYSEVLSILFEPSNDES